MTAADEPNILRLQSARTHAAPHGVWLHGDGLCPVFAHDRPEFAFSPKPHVTRAAAGGRSLVHDTSPTTESAARCHSAVVNNT